MADWTAVERCRKPEGYGKRHLLAILGFCGFALSYAMRFSLSIAIVAMINHSALQALRQESGALGVKNNETSQQILTNSIVFKSDVCPHDDTPHKTVDLNLNLFHVQTIILNSHGHETNNSSGIILPPNELNSSTKTSAITQGDEDMEEIQLGPVPEAHVVEKTEEPTKEDDGEFIWNEADQGVILGSFFWGYMVTQIFGGWLSQKIGGKWPFGVGLLVTAIFSLATPIAARYGGMYWLIFVRIVQGLAGGVTVPAMQQILSNWFTPEERGKLGSFTLAGMPFGTAITFLCSGFLIHYWGWPSVFYVTGITAIIWFILWSYFAHGCPAADPTIDKAELDYIQSALGSSGHGRQARSKLKVPWISVLLSGPFWAILVCNTCETWGLYTINAELPTYMKTVLHFDIKQNSVLSAVPHLLTLIVSVILTNVGDRLIEHKYMSIGAVRKLSTSIAMWGFAGALLAAAYSGCNRVKTVTLIAMAMGLNGGKFGGFLVNIIDIAPDYSGILMGIINTVASLPGFFAPWVAGIILNDNPSLENWRLVFLITAGIAFLGNVIYLLCASGEEQDWNRNGQRDEASSSSFSMGAINQVILSSGTMKSQQNNGGSGTKADNENGHLYIIPLNSVHANEPSDDPLPVVHFGQRQLQVVPDSNESGPRCSA